MLKNLERAFCFYCIHTGDGKADVYQKVVAHLGLGHKAEGHLPSNPSELDLTDLLGSNSRHGRGDSTYALKVEGDSMKDEGILSGDYVLVERTEVARNGDRVVALLPDGQTTLKTFYKDDDCIRLQPANPAFDPIKVKYCQVQGIVKGVVRRY